MNSSRAAVKRGKSMASPEGNQLGNGGLDVCWADFVQHGPDLVVRRLRNKFYANIRWRPCCVCAVGVAVVIDSNWKRKIALEEGLVRLVRMHSGQQGAA
jgi:hypothetical protein